jgi:hypothetical protein
MSYRIWEAAIAAGATLDELAKLEEGKYKRAFLTKLVAWYNMNTLIEVHTDEAKSSAMKRRAKR